ISIITGSPQATLINTVFPEPLVAKVTSPFGDPVAGGIVTFTPPVAGASASLSSTTATIQADGTTTPVTATANGTVGTYDVVASATGIAVPADFVLTNLPIPVPTPTAIPINSIEGFQLVNVLVATFTVTPLPGETSPLPASAFGATINWGDGSPTG